MDGAEILMMSKTFCSSLRRRSFVFGALLLLCIYCFFTGRFAMLSFHSLPNSDSAAAMLSSQRIRPNTNIHHHKLLILLRTGSANSTRRVQSIKQTWASNLVDGQLQIMKGNERCNRKYGDYHWAGLTCLEATNHIEIMNNTLTNFTWLLIVDDDTYVVVDRLTNLLDRLDPHQPSAFGIPYCGNCGKNRKGFCGGGGYFISRTNLLRMAGLRDRPVLPSVAHAFIEHFMQEPDRIWCDVRFGCVAQDMGLRLINQPGLYANEVKDENEEKRIIRLEEGYPPLVFHKVSNHSQMHRIHDLVVEMASQNATWTKIVEEPDWQGEPASELEAPLQPHINEECSSILLYVSDVISQYGLGYQLNNYILAVLLASYLNRSLVVLDPPINGESHSKFDGNSQFGCPPDDPNNTTNFQSGLGTLIDYPAWLNKGCSMPCSGEYNYSFWHGVAQSKETRRNEVSPDTEHLCTEEDGRNVSVLPIGGDLRHLLMSPKFNMSENLARKASDWVSRIGATQHEVGWLANHSQSLSLDSIYDQISALISRAGVVTFQPWVVREVHSFISRFDLPKRYVAFHVRRGDKLIAEAKYWVDEYWAKQGYNETTQPSNYIPFSQYLKQVQKEQEAGVLTDVYIATDDQDTVKQEIKLSGFSNVSFHMNPDASSTVHLQSDMECSKRYNRTIAAIADLNILSQSDIFVGEYNSNWGRLVHTARTSFVDGMIGTARQFDMRIAFGSESRGIPGT